MSKSKARYEVIHRDGTVDDMSKSRFLLLLKTDPQAIARFRKLPPSTDNLPARDRP